MHQGFKSAWVSGEQRVSLLSWGVVHHLCASLSQLQECHVNAPNAVEAITSSGFTLSGAHQQCANNYCMRAEVQQNTTTISKQKTRCVDGPVRGGWRWVKEVVMPSPADLRGGRQTQLFAICNNTNTCFRARPGAACSWPSLHAGAPRKYAKNGRYANGAEVIRLLFAHGGG